jgi:plasmid stabilization system protein ParE
MRFYFHPEAKEEFEGAVDFYEQSQAGLGLEFAEEVYATIARIVQYPDAWSVLSENSRRCLVNRFPYGLIYQIKSPALRIIAVAHLHRRPGYWKERLEQNKSLKRGAAKNRRAP